MKEKNAKLIPFNQQLSPAFRAFPIRPVGLLPRVLFLWHMALFGAPFFLDNVSR